MEGKRILLVEDSGFLAEVYANVLRESGAEVEVVHTGEEGCRKASEGGFDLLLLDIVLPDIDGFEIVKRLRENPPKTKNGDVIFLTSLDGDNEVERAKAFGGEYILKSEVDPGMLVERVVSHFSVTAS